jgi:adenine-specific DNA-methyltransferase
MPVLTWIGKDKVVNHDKELPFRVLKPVKELSVGDNSENLLIEGDNLEALKALMPFYYGKVKCIYIDPPYNTGNEGWVYNDRVNSPQIKSWLNKVVGTEGEDLCRHDKWLCMMYPRLKLLKELLAEDGAIFVSIDDNEVHNLRAILDEIFGEKNFQAQIIIQSNKRGHTYKQLAKTHEYVLCYSKSEKTKLYPLTADDNHLPEQDKLGSFSSRELRNRNPKFGRFNRPNLFYPIYVNPSKKDENGYYPLSLEKTKEFSVEVFPLNSRNEESCWRWGTKKLKDNIKEGSTDVVYGKRKQNDEWRIFEKYRIDTVSAKTIWDETEMITEQGTTQLRQMGLREEFPFPKPVGLIAKIIKLMGDTNGIYLDSFAGSGTTGQAILELNKEDDGNRKFILVELEKEIAKNVTVKRLSKIVKGYGDALFPEGTGQGLQYLDLNGELYNQSGFVNPDAHYEDMAAYVYFTETKNYLDIPSIKNPYIGSQGSTHYFLFFEGKDNNVLDEKTLKKTDDYKGNKVIYADKCLLDEEYLLKKGIIFKQIPYELKKY